MINISANVRISPYLVFFFNFQLWLVPWTWMVMKVTFS